jgi:membrane protease YdiL (CAAX protease family)
MLVRFFALTYIISWAWFGASAYILHCAGSSPAGAGSLLFLPGVVMPALVAIALTAKSQGRAGLSELLGGIIQWRVNALFYVFAVGYMIAIKLASAVVYRIAFGGWPSFTSVPWYFLAVAALVSTPVQAGEEIGWRGYALPRLAKRFGLPIASVILGITWAGWHLPFFYIPGSDNAGQSFPIYLVAVTAISVPMAWLYWKTNQSVLLTMLMHASIDNTAAIASSPTPATVSNPFALPQAAFPWITALLLCLAALCFLIQMQNRRRKIPRLSLPIF